MLLTPEIYHQLAKNRRKIPCQPTRLYGDLLPLIVVDASTRRELAVDTRAKCNTLTKQMEKTVRTYYLRKQQVIAHIEGERRQLYKRALALHRATMAASNVNNNRGWATILKNNNEEITPSSSSTTPESTHIVLETPSQELHSPDDEKFSFAEDELLIPSITPDQVEPPSQSNVGIIKKTITVVDEDDKEEDEDDESESLHYSISVSSTASSSPSELSSSSRKKPSKHSKFDDNEAATSDDDLLLPTLHVVGKSRWPKMPPPAINEAGLETIAEIARRTTGDSADSSSLRHSVRVTITKADRTFISDTDGETQLIVAKKPEKINVSNNAKPNYKTQDGNKTLLKTKIATVAINENNKNTGQMMIPNNNKSSPLTTKLPRPPGMKVAFDENNVRQDDSSNDSAANLRASAVVDEPRDSLVAPPTNYYKMSLISMDNNYARKKKTIVRVKPLIPGKSRYIDWQLQPDGRYKSRIVTYEVPQFKFETEPVSLLQQQQDKNNNNLQIAGKGTMMKAEIGAFPRQNDRQIKTPVALPSIGESNLPSTSPSTTPNNIILVPGGEDYYY